MVRGIKKAWQRINNKKLALEYSIGKITVAHWHRNWLILKQFSSQKFSEESFNRKNVKKLEFEKKNKWAVVHVVYAAKAEGSSDFRPNTARKILFIRNIKDKWKKRYGLHQLHVCRENLSGNSKVVSDLIEKYKSCIKENLSPEKIYNCNEGLNFKLLPAKTLASC